MSGAALTMCATIAASPSPTANETCVSTLAVYAQAGACGAAHFDAGLPPNDASLSCVLTGTCPDSGGRATMQCTPAGACGTAQYQMCVTTGAGVCSASIVPPAGVSGPIPCSSCGDCTAAETAAAEACATGGGDDGGHPRSGDSGSSTDAGVSCGSTPTLHPETEAGVYCPFTPTGSVHCAATQECCESPGSSSDMSSCVDGGATCPITGSLAWNCNGPLDCPGSTCCAAGTVAEDTTCGFERGSGFTGSHCAASCPVGEVVICDQTTFPCPSGTCTPFKVSGVVLGTCL
jgi:hypothetical protein